jgi:DNA-binding helix-hairpin-helix protein with protein kinase domain
VHLGKKIGSGGEGEVFEIPSTGSKYVAKIYKKALDVQKQEKLRLMAQGCNDDLKGIAAWPTDVLQAKKGGPVCGFVMPRVSGYEPVHKVYGPTHRKEIYPGADWRFLLRVAKNLAAAFDVIHTYGYVVGDVNEGNILVNDRACVQLIDCDSFQVQSGDKFYYCEVGVAQFTPPEIQNSKDFRKMRTPNQDNFGLAILIFLLLFMGRHPYAGVYSGKEDMPIERAIAEYRFAFSKNAASRRIAPPPDSVGLSIVPQEIATLFEQAFSETGARMQSRPAAGTWWKALDALERRMRICTADPIHRYYSGLQYCPWCRLEHASGIQMFLSSDAASRIDIATEWRKVERVRPPGPVPAISPKDYLCEPKPLTPDIERAVTLTKVRSIAAVMIAGMGLIFGYLLYAGYLEIILTLVIAAVIGCVPGKDAKEKRQRKILADNARYNWALWNKKWKKEAGDEEFVALFDDMIRLRRLYEGVEQEFRSAHAALRSTTTRERQLAGYLQRCYIDNDPTLRIGPNQRAALRSFGIETASDITVQKLTRIKELNDAARGTLLLWRGQREKAFVFNPSYGNDQAETGALLHRYQPRLNAIEQDMRQGLEKLCQVQQRILNNRARFRPFVERSAKDMAQAHADYSVFPPGLLDLL